MRHLTRDFLTMVSASCPGTNMYALSIFLMGCGGYSVVGQTNFDLHGWQLAHGTSASLGSANTGQARVSIPVNQYQIPSNVAGSILCLKSHVYPRANSGLFRVLSVDTVNNTLTVDYRSNDNPPDEDFLTWNIFVDEQTAASTWQRGANATSGYASWTPNQFNTASCSRVILKSPDPTSWEVRFCLESSHDVSGSVPSGFSIAPGFGGNGSGDFFPVNVRGYDHPFHLHGAHFYNTTSSDYRGMTVGLTPVLKTAGGNIVTKGQWRISMLVDDVSGSCVIVNRNVSLPATVRSGSGWAAFGLCEDEPSTALRDLGNPQANCPRLFVAGSSNASSNLTWKSQFHDDNNIQVVGFSKRGYPIPGVLSSYSDSSNPSNSHIRYVTSSVTGAWNNGLELLDVEVLVGTLDQSHNATGSVIFPLQPRRLGRLPMVLQGRANFPTWSLGTTPTQSLGGGGGGILVGSALVSSYYHTLDGLYLEWNGPTPVDAFTSSSYIVTSGTINSQEGLVSYAAFHQGKDPDPPAVLTNQHDIDATRYRKTYSYYRQVPVNVGIAKGGSNPSKS